MLVRAQCHLLVKVDHRLIGDIELAGDLEYFCSFYNRKEIVTLYNLLQVWEVRVR